MHVSKFAALLILAPSFVFLSNPLRAQTAPTTPSAVTVDDESTLYGAKWSRLIETDLVEEKFDDLDSMAAKFRGAKTRMTGGEWKLDAFYGVLDKPMLTDKDTLEHLAHLKHWIAQRPESITARVALATSLHRWA